MVISRAAAIERRVLPVTARPEVELVLCGARVAHGPATVHRVGELCTSRLDWSLIRSIGLAHGVWPMLYRSLQLAGGRQVPAGTLDQLRQDVRSSARHNLLLTGRLLRVVAALDARGVRALAFKGPMIALPIYGDLALRPFVDVDVLVPRHDVDRARAVLSELGYREDTVHPWEACYKDDASVSVDLHWGLGPSYDPVLPFKHLWDRRTAVELLGAEVQGLRPDDLLVLLSIQLVKDWRAAAPRLLKLCDIAELLRRHTAVDWDAVNGLARAAGGERILLLSLLLAHELLGAPVPEPMLSTARGSRPIRGLARDYERRLFPVAGSAGAADRRTQRADTFAAYVAARERGRDKLRYMALRARDRVRLALRPSRADREFLPLPGSLHFLYYAVRPLRIVSTWVRAGTKAVRRQRPGAAGRG